MILREDLEKREYSILSPFAAKSAESKGREHEEAKCEFRTDFQRDRDRIVHSKSFRRLMHKTQVFLAPEGDHFRTRLTHTLEVSQIARTIARGLGLNEDLAEAIALGHDLGHTPFGHNGEILEGEKEYTGINLTIEVRDGILNHTGTVLPMTLEGQIVKISDRIAYINHDIDDAIRSKVISFDCLPKECIKVLGIDHRSRINTLVGDIIKNSDGKDRILQSLPCSESMDDLRTYMFENVYHNNIVKKDEDLDKVKNIIFYLYNYYFKKKELNTEEGQGMNLKYGVNEVVKDYIAGMTDRFAMNLYDDLFIPKGWK